MPGPTSPANLVITLGPNEQISSIGPYVVNEAIGKGGMGIVHEVHRGRDVFALKTIETRFLADEDNLAEPRFAQEVRILKRVRHPNVVRLFDFGFAQHPLGYRMAFLVMERLRGQPLSSVLAAEKRLTTARALGIAAEVAAGIKGLEASGVIHRDVKPANVFVTEDDRVVLLDFGLARGSGFTRLTRAGQVIGTLAYMSPEALRGEEVDSRTDVYAVGVLLFEMLMGAPPFAGKSPTAVLRRIETGLKWPSGEPPMSPAVTELVRAALAIDRGRRPSPSELLGALRTTLAALRGPTEGPFDASPSGSAGRVGALRVALIAGLTFAAGIGVGRWSVPTSSTESIPVAVKTRDRPLSSSVGRSPSRTPPVEPERKTSETRPVFADAATALRFGVKAMNNQRYEEAVHALRQATKHNPALANAHKRLGDALVALRELGAAADSYKVYLTLRPDPPDGAEIRAVLSKIQPRARGRP